jgi:hypothetical protein
LCPCALGGVQTSQFFANLYLDDFDHWLKEDLRVGPYLRYVDDFCVFGDDKSRLNQTRAAIIERLASLRLRIHDGKSRIYTRKEGVEFLGFRHLPGTVRVRKENTKRFRSRMRRSTREYASGRIGWERVRASVTAWIAHASYGDSAALRQRIVPRYSFK